MDTIILQNNLTNAIPVQHLTGFEVTTPGTGYSFGSTQTLSCTGTCTVGTGIDTLATPAVMAPVSATAGSPGTTTQTGSYTVTLSDQTALAGHPTTVGVTLATSGGVNGINPAGPFTISNAGSITAIAGSYSSSTGLYTESVTGCGLTGGPTLELSYGVKLEQTIQSGIYSAAPSCSGGTVTSLTSTIAAASGLMVDSCNIYPSTAAWGTDNTAAFQAAIGAMNAASAAGSPTCLYVPAGTYLTLPLDTGGAAGTSQTIAQHYGCIFGDGHYLSNIFVIPNTAGDVFAWLDAGNNTSSRPFAPTQTFSNTLTPNQAGSAFRGMTIIGNRASTATVNALSFYGPTSDLLIDDVVIRDINGHAIGAGYGDTQATPTGNLAHSRIQNARFENDGNGLATPVMEITATSAPGSRDIDLLDLRFFQSWGPSLWIHAGTTATSSARDIRILNMKAEESAMSEARLGAAPAGDELLLGGGNPGTGNINISNVSCRNLQLENPLLGYAGLHIEGDGAADTTAIDCEGSVATSTDYGRGVQIDACAGCAVREAQSVNSAAGADSGLLVGTPTVLGSCAGARVAPPGVLYAGNGAESSLAACIDPAAAGFVSFQTQRLLANAHLANAAPSPPIPQAVSFVTSAAGTVLSFGSAVLPKPAQPLWTVVRTGPSSGFTDHWDSAADIIAAINTAAASSLYVQPGQIFRVRVCNRGGGVETLAAPVGSTIAGTVTLAGVASVPAGSCVNFALGVASLSLGGSVTILGA